MMDAKRTLFSDYIIYWLSTCKMRVDIVTYQGYEGIAYYISRYFMDKEIYIDSITTEDIQKYITDIYDHGRSNGGPLSPRTVGLHMNIINQAVKLARRTGILNYDPCEFVITPKGERFEAKFYNENQVREMLGVFTGDIMYPYIYTTLVLGLRRSEALGLKWDSIDFSRDTLTIKHTVCKVSSVVEKNKTKNRSSYRTYPLSPELRTMFMHMKQLEEYNRSRYRSKYYDSDRIFKFDDGKPFSPDFVSHHFLNTLRKNGLPEIRLHDLRHTCASLMINNGFQLKDISAWLGHSNIGTTADIYGHLDMSRKMQITMTMGSMFSA